MKKIIFLWLLLISFNTWAENTDSVVKPYKLGDWNSILKSSDGKPIAVHFWGVTCSPCVKEMPQWGNLTAIEKNAKVIFIQVDDVSLGMIKKMLQQAKLGNANNYYIADAFDERLRYEINPKWRGETPMTIWIDKSGNKEMTVGSVNFQMAKAWLKKNN